MSIHYLGYFAGLLTVSSFVPQVVRVWRTRHTRDLSLAMFALLFVSASLWTVYGVFTADWPVVVTNSAVVVLNLILVAAKARYR